MVYNIGMKKQLLSLAIAAFVAVPLVVAEMAPLSMSPKFWTTLTPSAVVTPDGTLSLDGTKRPTFAFYSAESYGDVSLEARYSVAKANGVMAVGFIIGSTDPESFIRAHYDRRSVILSQCTAGEPHREIKRMRKDQAPDTWYTAKLVRKGKTLEVFFNGKKLYEAEVPDTPGRVGFYASQTVGTVKDIHIDGVRVPLAKPWKNLEEGRIHGVPREQARAEIIWTRAICPSKDRYIGWPTVCRRRDGELLAVFSGDRIAHVCPWGKVQMVRSSDNGETWSAPVTLKDGVADDRDAGILELADGTLVVNWFSSVVFAQRDEWKAHFKAIPNADLIRDVGYFTMRSTDGGKTWEAPVRMLGSTPHGGIQLKSGRLMTIGRYQKGGGNVVDGWDDPRLKLGKCALTVEVSDDGARSWQLLSKITPNEPYKFGQLHEPYLVELDDGTILAHFRHHGDGGNQLKRSTLQCESTDAGKTWTPLHPTGIRGYPTHLLKLKGGRLLAVYGCRIPGRIGEWAAVSDDNGKTWDVAREIRIAGGISSDLGYPSTVQLDDGSLLTVYYQAFKCGENPSLMATKWRLK